MKNTSAPVRSAVTLKMLFSPYIMLYCSLICLTYQDIRGNAYFLYFLRTTLICISRILKGVEVKIGHYSFVVLFNLNNAQLLVILLKDVYRSQKSDFFFALHL